MRLRTYALAVALIVALTATSVIAAPYRWLSDASGSPPRAQWFKDVATDAVDDAHFEYYDNPYPGGLPDYPWGGDLGSAAVSGWVTDIQYTPNDNIIGFTIQAGITNDTYTCFWGMNGTSGWSNYGQSAPEIALNFECYLYDVRLTLDFADAGLSPSPSGQIYATGCDELAWYYYSESEPPQTGGPYYYEYCVPTFRFGNLAPGQSATRSISCGLYAPLPPTDPLNDLLVESKAHQTDIFANRTKALKVAQYPSAIFTDDGTSWPDQYGYSGDVSVFFDTNPSLGAAYVQVGPNTPSNHYWWEGQPRESPNEMIQIAVTAGPDEDVELQTMQLQASGWADDRTGITDVKAYLDNNGDGLADPGETIVAVGHYDADDGICALAFSPSLSVPAGGTVNLVVAYTMAAGNAYWSTFSFSAIRMRATGVTSGGDAPVYGLPLSSCTKTVIQPPVVVSIGQAKQLELGRTVILENKVLTAQLWSYYNWIEEEDRSSGIRVYTDYPVVPPPPPTGSAGRELLTLLGVTALDGTEATITALDLDAVYDPLNPPPAPLAMSNRSTGGSSFGIQQGVINDAGSSAPATGLNNIGMLVRTCGVITYVYAPWQCIWIDDGSNLFDGTLNSETQEPVRGMCVMLPYGWQEEDAPQPGTYAVATGLMGCWDSGGGTVARFLSPRDAADVLAVPGPEPR